jgi:hypothetical protein
MANTFGDLIQRIHHDVGKGEKDELQMLADNFAPFMDYCEETKLGDISKILSEILALIKNENVKAQQEHIRESVENLKSCIKKAVLKDVEPNFFYTAVDVYESNQQGGIQVALCLKDGLLKELLIKVLNIENPSYRLHKCYLNKNYSIFRFKDVLEDHKTIIICDNSFVERLITHGCPERRIVYMDFSKMNRQTFLKSILLPCSITEFKDILSLQ